LIDKAMPQRPGVRAEQQGIQPMLSR